MKNAEQETRAVRLSKKLIQFATYGDDVADMDIDGLLHSSALLLRDQDRQLSELTQQHAALRAKYAVLLARNGGDV